MLNNKIAILKDEYDHIKKTLKVDDQYLAQQQAQLERKRTTALNLKNHYYDQLNVYAGLKEDGQKQLLLTMEQLGLRHNDLAGLEDWKKPFNSVHQWIAGAKVGNILVAQNELGVYKEYIEGQIELEKNRLLEEELNVDIVRSWNKMTMHKFVLDTDQEINAEVIHYDHIKNELETTLSSILDKKIAATTTITKLTRSLSNLKNKINDLSAQEDRLFKDHASDYTQVRGLLKNAQDHLSSQIDLLNKLLDLYAQLNYKVTMRIKKIQSVIGRLQEKSWWVQVSEIKWEQIRTFIPHINRFVQDYLLLGKKFFSKENTIGQSFASSLHKIFHHPLESAKSIFQFILLMALFVLVRLLLPYIQLFLSRRAEKSIPIYKYSFATLLTINFLQRHAITLFVWLFLFIQIALQNSTNNFLNISFYLLSIPFLIYYAYHFILYLQQNNALNGFVLITKEYENRFFFAFSLFVYSSCIILFFRQAFLILDYNSDVPTLLLALNFIVLQLALISLIDKKHVLTIIPTHTPLWEWIEENINRFYYLLFVIALGIIILSNPYLGYGRLVLPIFLRIIFTLSALPLLSWLYKAVRKVSLDLFFTSDDETIKERFTYSKTWHGFFCYCYALCFCRTRFIRFN